MSAQSTLSDDISILSFEIYQDVPDDIGQAVNPDVLAFELGVWLAGLKTFFGSPGRLFGAAVTAESGRDWSKECKLVHSVLLIAARLTSKLHSSVRRSADPSEEIQARDLDEVSRVIRDSVVLTESFIRSKPADIQEFGLFCNAIGSIFDGSRAVEDLIDRAAHSGEEHLPESILELIHHRSLPFSDEADILSVLTEIGSILRSLALIGQRLKNDEPLKPALFLFVWVNKLTRDLVAHINNRLARFPDETVDLFNSLDAASYTVSIELKKVFNQELSGLLSMRPATSVYARFETAYALLTDSFLQVLAGFAVLVDPAVSTYDLFPNFQMRLDKSLKLRKHLWQILERVRKAESGTEKSAADELIKDLQDFQSTSLGLLYFKDTETVERFCEEIIGTRNSKDLIPLLHRFGAYLETLFGQVNMRSVLASHPFTGEAQ